MMNPRKVGCGFSSHVSSGRARALRDLPRCVGANADSLEDELSEEDQQLKDELEMLVERLKV